MRFKKRTLSYITRHPSEQTNIHVSSVSVIDIIYMFHTSYKRMDASERDEKEEWANLKIRD